MSNSFRFAFALAPCVVGLASLAACGDSSGSSASGGAGGAGSAGGDAAPSAAGTGGSAASGGDNEPAGMEGMTATHNAARAAVDPAAASPLPDLIWDPDLAAIAQAYAEVCVFEHSGADGLGENLFANAGSVVTAPTVVDAWVSEDAFFDYDANSCAPGEMCGHYTQVVWADSLRLGCGYAQCTVNSPFNGFTTWDNWVCNYDPPGNYIGEKPY